MRAHSRYDKALAENKHSLKWKVIYAKESVSKISESKLQKLFPTCQVRLVRFYVSHRAVLLLLLLNRACRTAVFPAGPQQPAQDGSVPRRTSTASPGRLFPAKPQPRAASGSGPRLTSSASSGRWVPTGPQPPAPDRQLRIHGGTGKGM